MLHQGGLSAGVLNGCAIAGADHENSFCRANSLASLPGIKLVEIHALYTRGCIVQKIGQQVGTAVALCRQTSSHGLRELPDSVTRLGAGAFGPACWHEAINRSGWRLR